MKAFGTLLLLGAAAGAAAFFMHQKDANAAAPNAPGPTGFSDNQVAATIAQANLGVPQAVQTIAMLNASTDPAIQAQLQRAMVLLQKGAPAAPPAAAH